MYLLLLNFYKLKGTKLDSTKPSPKELSIFRDELIKDADTVDLIDTKKAASGEYYKQLRKKIKKF